MDDSTRRRQQWRQLAKDKRDELVKEHKRKRHLREAAADTLRRHLIPYHEEEGGRLAVCSDEGWDVTYWPATGRWTKGGGGARYACNAEELASTVAPERVRRSKPAELPRWPINPTRDPDP